MLVAHGAVRDANVTNESGRVRPRASRAWWTGASDELVRWHPELQLSTTSWRGGSRHRRCDSAYGFDGTPLVDRLALRGWRPQASWALGRMALEPTSRTQWLTTSRSRAARREAPQRCPALSRNGQQFDAIASHTFGYRAPPVVSPSPRAGAAMAHTAVVVHGANLRHAPSTGAPSAPPSSRPRTTLRPPRHARPEPTVHREAPPLPPRSTHVVVEATVSLNGTPPVGRRALGAFERQQLRR